MVYVPNFGDYRDTIGFNNLLEGNESKRLSIFDVPKGYVSPLEKLEDTQENHLDVLRFEKKW